MILRKIRTFLNLEHQERSSVFFFTYAIPMIAIWLRISGFKKTQNRLKRWAYNNKLTSSCSANLEKTLFTSIQRAFRIALRNAPYKGNCLSQSLALWCQLQRIGITADLRIGTRKEQGKFAAHAWIEYDGIPVSDSVALNGSFQSFDESFEPQIKSEQ